MNKHQIQIGLQKLKNNEGPVNGDYIKIENEVYFRISNYDKIKPFFMSIVSSSDHWMFISSKGSLSAGRKNPDNALFPYYTDDKIHDNHDITGSKTVLRVEIDETKYLWEPFAERYLNVYNTSKNIYKNMSVEELRDYVRGIIKELVD